MKIRHNKLELIRKNPENYHSIVNGVGQPRASMLRYWQFAARKFHQNNNDSNLALQYLEENIKNHFKPTIANSNKMLELMKNLDLYFIDYKKNKFKFCDGSNRISYDVANGNFITGEIFRLDKKKDNYYITLFYKEDEIWANELRFPLIQIYFSNILKWPVDQIYVGIFNYSQIEHEHISYDESALNYSLEEVKDIFKKIYNNY